MKHIKEKTLCTKDYKIHDRAWTSLTGGPSADELEGSGDEQGAVAGETNELVPLEVKVQVE